MFVYEQFCTYTNITKVRIRKHYCLYTSAKTHIQTIYVRMRTPIFFSNHTTLRKFCRCKDSRLFVHKHNVVYIRAHLHVYKHVERLYTNTVIVYIRTEKNTYTNKMLYTHKNFQKLSKVHFCRCEDSRLFAYKHNVVCIRSNLFVYEHEECLYTNRKNHVYEHIIVCIRAPSKFFKN